MGMARFLSRTKEDVYGAAGTLVIGLMFAGFALVGFCVVVGSLCYVAVRMNLDGAASAVSRWIPRRQAA